MRGLHIRQWIADFRHGLRQLRLNPGFTVVAVVTLALGIGANTAIFSMLEGVVLKPLPFADPSRLVTVWDNNPRGLHISASYLDFRDWQNSARSFQQMAGLQWTSRDLTSPGPAEHVDGKAVSAGFFSLLGRDLAMGREFTLQEDRQGGTPVVIISDQLWRERFASSRDVLGKIVTLNGIGYSVVGVLTPGFRFDTTEPDADVYTPLGQGDFKELDDRTVHPGIICVARLAPGITLGQAQAEMRTIQEQLDQQYPGADRGIRSDVTTLEQEFVGGAGETLLLLLGAVGLVLLIACANIANLLLARAAGRTRDFAIRLALGANRSDILRQLIAESLILSLAGGVLGVVLAEWGLAPLLALAAGSLPRTGDVTVNIPVLLFTFALALLVGVLFGLAPAIKSSNTDLQVSLKEGGRGMARATHRVQRVLVVSQMALTLVLLAGASLLFRTVQHLWESNPGFNPRHIITFKVGLSPSATRTPAQTRLAFGQLLDRVRNIPGVDSADLTTLVPLGQSDNSGPFWFGPQTATSMAAEAPRAIYFETGPDYLRVMGIPLLRGRYFTAGDNLKSEKVVVIDSALAHAYFPHRDPVGQHISVAHWGEGRIIGVIGHVKHWGLGDEHRHQNQIYIAFSQLADEWIPEFYASLTMLVRTTLDAPAAVSAIKHEVYGAGSDQPVYAVKTMDTILSASITSQRLPMILLGVFAGLALTLATVGIYGVISYLTAQRAHEIGIRMALGAGKRNVFGLVLGQGLRLALGGIVMGTAGALALAPVLSSFSRLLYGVRAADPLTLAAVSLVLITTAVLACYIPARRASRVDPMVALRHE
ncbi:MAG TPA: ABC transporter permease [Bryobacteraceae bacterium]|nr:ABC transporter permease [Bryobacteraceae bacterium]